MRCSSALGYLLWLPFHDETWQALINMGIAGLGSGALVAALPAAAAAAAPPERTGIATGMTNGTKTVGGAIASAIFAIALTATGSLDGRREGTRRSAATSPSGRSARAPPSSPRRADGGAEGRVLRPPGVGGALR